MKTVNILLTKHSDWMSMLVYYLTGRGYTHAALSLQEDEDCYYSFSWKGFALESPEKYRRRGVEHSICFQIEIPDCAYHNVKTEIIRFQQTSVQWKYTKIGVVFALLRIPFRWEKHFFCSQFVAYILQSSNALSLRKNENLYLPNHFVAELSQYNGLVQIAHNII